MLRVCHNVFAQRECGWMRDTIATGRRYWGRLQVFTCQPCACLSQCLAQSWVVLWSCTATTSLLLASTVSTSNPNPGLSSLSKSHVSHLPLRLKKLTPVKVRMFWVCVLLGIKICLVAKWQNNISGGTQTSLVVHSYLYYLLNSSF